MKESQLDNKTSIATNDYVRMVDENGNSVKIKKDSFMAAIRDALPSIISDGETGGGSVLSIINGALKTRTDANLASVLGALPPIQTNTITQDNVDSFTFGRVTHGFSIGSGSSIGVLFAIPRAYGGYDLQIDFGDVAMSWRIRTGTSWSLWNIINKNT